MLEEIGDSQTIRAGADKIEAGLAELQKMTEPGLRVVRDQVFISYSHQDREWLERLQVMLKPLLRKDALRIWDDSQIRPGAEWRQDIENALASAAIAVLLVSPHFLASDFIAEHELPPLLEAAKREGVKILWVAVSYCLVEETEIELYQAVNGPAKPLSSFSGAELDRELLQIAKAIKAAVQTSPQAVGAADSSRQPGPVSSPPQAAMSFSRAERLNLIQQLNALPGAQFNTLLLMVNPPPSVIPAPSAALSDRVFALITWAEGTGGCGLPQVKQDLEDLIRPQ